MRTLPKIKEVFPLSYDGKGIFSEMLSPIWGTTFQASDLDIQFFSENDEKKISPLVSHFLTVDMAETLSDTSRTRISALVQARYGDQWSRLFGVYQAQYEAIENYRMTETETGSDNTNIVKSETVDKDETASTTIVLTDNDNNTETVTNSGTASTGVYGYNSAVSVPTDTGTTTGTNTTTTDNEKTQNSTNTETRGEITDVDETTTNTATTNRALSRSGNIGVTTSQQMLEAEISLWKFNFLSNVFADTAKMLSTPIY